MAHICLINPPGLKTISGIQGNNPSPPIGLAYIAARIRQCGHQVTVIDATGEAMDKISRMRNRDDILIQGLTVEEIVDRLPAGADAIGIACGFSTVWPITRQIGEAVRRARPGLPLFVGGEHPTALPEHVLETGPFDVCVIGEGDETIAELLPRLLAGEDLSGVSGIAYRDAGGIHRTAGRPRLRKLDQLPWPAWELFPMEEYISRKQMIGIHQGRAMPVLATRGCPFRCTFCSSPQMWTTAYAMRSVKDICDEMQFYMERYQATDFHFQDLTAIVNKRWTIDFCKELLRRNMKITWQLPCGTRCESIDDEVCGLLAASGCRNLTYAPESGSEEIRRLTHKQVNTDKMMASIRAALRHKLDLCCFFLIGVPQETRESLRASLRLIRRLAWMGVQDVGVSMFVPYPGSKLFQQMLDAGKIELNDDYFLSPMDFCSHKRVQMCENPDLDARTLYRWMLRLFLNFYLLSFVLHPLRTTRMLARYVLAGREESRFAKWLRDRVETRRRWRKALAALDRRGGDEPCGEDTIGLPAAPAGA